MIRDKIREYLQHSERLIKRAEQQGQDVKEYKKAIEILKDLIKYLEKKGVL